MYEFSSVIDFRCGRTLSAGRCAEPSLRFASVPSRPARFVPQESPPSAPINKQILAIRDNCTLLEKPLGAIQVWSYTFLIKNKRLFSKRLLFWNTVLWIKIIGWLEWKVVRDSCRNSGTGEIPQVPAPRRLTPHLLKASILERNQPLHTSLF